MFRALCGRRGVTALQQLSSSPATIGGPLGRGMCSRGGFAAEKAAFEGESSTSNKGRWCHILLTGGGIGACGYLGFNSWRSVSDEDSSFTKIKAAALREARGILGSVPGEAPGPSPTRDMLLARRLQATLRDGTVSMHQLPRFEDVFSSLSQADSEILICRLELLLFYPRNQTTFRERASILEVLRERGEDIPSRLLGAV